ncbi:GNAT family N-acetyltransferase [Brevibacillus sp. SYSU BS000544]|uniref:GNAT family N-acetyltransferase n=1 Tax=Brevibacillus sp. SYSU BS000544 TaxID=3416443 RepID=UPI003CE51BE5
MIRSFVPEDIEYVIRSHTEIYGNEYNFDDSFKTFIQDSTSRFVSSFDPTNENLWIAEIDGRPVGSIAIIKVGQGTAQLRWFLLEPEARGKSLGHRLMQTAIDFAKEKGYQRIFLWTSNLHLAARFLYNQYGFQITETSEEIRSEISLVEERWEKIL